MAIIVNTIKIEVGSKFVNELDNGLEDLGIEPVHSDFYETEFMGKEETVYCVQVEYQCNCKEEEKLFNFINNFKHGIRVSEDNLWDIE